MKKDVSGFAYILPIGIFVLCHASSAFAQSIPTSAACNGLQAVHADAIALGTGAAGLPIAAEAQRVDLRGSVPGTDGVELDDVVTISAVGAMALDADMLSGGGSTGGAANENVGAARLALATVPVGDDSKPPITADAVVIRAADSGLRQKDSASTGLASSIGNAATFLTTQISALGMRVDRSLRGIVATLSGVMTDGSSVNLFSSPSYQLRGIVPADASEPPTIINAANDGPTAIDNAVRVDGSDGMAFGRGMATVRAEKSARTAMPARWPA